MFSRRPSRKALAQMCRKLSTMLDAGVTIHRALQTLQAGRSGIDRAVIQDACASVGAGSSAVEAFSLHPGYFPPLFLSLVEMGERTGTLERVLGHLADFYENTDLLARNVIRSMIYPACVITLAILVTALLKYIFTDVFANLKDIRLPPGTAQAAAIRHLVVWFGGIALAIGCYVFCRTVLKGAVAIDRFLLRVPVVGKALRSLAVARFTWAFQLAQAAGLGMPETVRRSLAATGNAAFIAATDVIVLEIEGGADLRTSLEASGLFLRDTLEMIEVAETSGKLEESMGRIAKSAFSDAEFSLSALGKAFGWLVWLIAAGVTVYYLFWFYTQYYGAIGAVIS